MSSISGEDEIVNYRGKAGKSQTAKEMHRKEADRQKRKGTAERDHVAEEQYSEEKRHTHKVRYKQELDQMRRYIESSQIKSFTSETVLKRTQRKVNMHSEPEKEERYETRRKGRSYMKREVKVRSN